ncbi:D-Ala-D-Ala carboxypeptidase family metallohydrolase [Eleftheria terrae]|uniref:D-Ala-D-Ala carboxypeptidase family metallohydrolase n=1 Tax=Eleftheria terrae TaxID=1597781 RepID=UPI00263AE06C|nr:D-Ala-D-Ala carboxypeptidase family metallohydrolase [Eleftheria terrae]WKB51797.1 D-Ala-D-Ala carboxypeptidase family metallohydrolase [Eleftheria terrae]
MNDKTTRLSKHFTLGEMTTTSQKIANLPSSPIVLDNLRQVCEKVLEQVREHFGKAVIIHSGYRGPAVNAAIGGSKTSQHMSGEAADFHVAGFTVYEVADWIANNLMFDQLILENFVPGIKTSGWVHCSYAKKNRRQVLTKFKGSKKYYPGLLLKP